MRQDNNSLAHTSWNCKYHIVFAPKYRSQIIYGSTKQVLVKSYGYYVKEKALKFMKQKLAQIIFTC